MKQTVYTASPESQQIHVWSLNHEGTLTLVQVVDVPGQVQPMVVSPDKRYLYVGVRPEFRVLAYRIAPDDGALTFATESALPGSPTHISTDHHGRFVFVGSYNAGNVSVDALYKMACRLSWWMWWKGWTDVIRRILRLITVPCGCRR
ncbi:6-phosphogluconolactonase [Salmonella enterica subsp. arizonae]|uniref:6-phosphogluconolactonase n=1 Tax=Salmonella enterica subsp. arizonae TaxID=59203 RepID=A0A379T0U4_SALER|nr:6-phosphogluconolactonase [Salmonella enterica subsp. arizonae]